MQAIARVNRVFRDKPGGLIVDYIGILQNLKNALKDYSPTDQGKTGIPEGEAEAVMEEAFQRVKAIFHGHDYQAGFGGAPQQRLKALAGAMDWVLKWQEKQAAKAATDETRKQAHRAYQDLVLALTKAYALASASDAAAIIRDEVGFFQTIRAAIAKSTATGAISQSDRTFAVQQLIDRAVASTEIIDVLHAAGIESPDISILSDDFLAEVQGMERKNLALEALRKLLNGEIRSRMLTNVVESRTFSKRLEEAVARYHTNAISAVEMINELIALAKDLQGARARGVEQGLSNEEIAFYDALAQNESAIEVLGNDTLRLIAHELLGQLRQNATVDWHKRESARARMRVLVKRILKKYGYPPDLAEDAVKLVLEQAEALLRQFG